jgi:hypothetical protein
LCRGPVAARLQELIYYRRPPRPFLAPFREADRLELLRLELLRLALFRPVPFLLALFRLALFRPPREDLPALFRAELLPPRLAAFPRLADLRALFFAPFRADFLLLPLAELREDFFLDPLLDPLRELLRDDPLPPLRLVEAGSSKSKDGDEVGPGEGVLSEGSGSIHPEPDQPISI